MKRGHGVWLAVLVGILFNPACDDDPVKQEEPDSRPLSIVDQTGKVWDITHAVQQYGFKKENFQFGNGPFAIEPLIDPPMVSPGEPGYPDPLSDEIVLGINLGGDARAYPILWMVNSEVVNTFVGNQYVAPVY